MAAPQNKLQSRWLLLGPATAVLVIFMLIPLLLMTWISIQARDFSGGVYWGELSPAAYVQVLFERQLDDTLALNSDYLSIFARSIWLSALTTVIALLVGFPTAFFMATRSPRWRAILVFMVTLPFWTNLLVRNYAWILLLRDHGTINGILMSLGIISEPLPLLHNSFAVSVGLTYSFLPFMVLPIYTSLEKFDFGLVEAGFDLYANRWQTLKHIVLPIVKPGVIAGCILVFVPSLGSYVTPALLGGGKTLMIGNLIGMQFGSSRNWPFGAALGILLLVTVVIAMLAYNKRVNQMQERR